jgi:hypothetical protein
MKKDKKALSPTRFLVVDSSNEALDVLGAGDSQNTAILSSNLEETNYNREWIGLYKLIGIVEIKQRTVVKKVS